MQGYTQLDPVTRQVITTGQPTDIVIPPGDLRPPVATTSFNAEINLDANATDRRDQSGIRDDGADLRLEGRAARGRR